MKKNTKKIAILLLVAVVAVGSYFVSGTYAKYTSEKTGTATARVAKWDVRLNKNQMSTATAFNFDLFNTINEADTTTTEEHVAAANGTDIIIAPGTGGSFDIELLNLSEVDAKYNIDFTVTNTANIPVEFKVNNGEWTSTLADIPASNSTVLAKNSTASTQETSGDETTITVYWRWAYERGTAPHTTEDAADTSLGNAGTATLSVQAKVTATQVD